MQNDRSVESGRNYSYQPENYGDKIKPDILLVEEGIGFYRQSCFGIVICHSHCYGKHKSLSRIQNLWPPLQRNNSTCLTVQRNFILLWCIFSELIGKKGNIRATLRSPFNEICFLGIELMVFSGKRIAVIEQSCICVPSGIYFHFRQGNAVLKPADVARRRAIVAYPGLISIQISKRCWS